MLDQTPEFLSHEGQVTPLWLDCDPGESYHILTPTNQGNVLLILM